MSSASSRPELFSSSAGSRAGYPSAEDRYDGEGRRRCDRRAGGDCQRSVPMCSGPVDSRGFRVPKTLEKAAGEDLLAGVISSLGSDFAARANVQTLISGFPDQRKNSLIADLIPCYAGNKFPVLVRREFARKALIF